MSWRREINYHGSRLYEADPDPSARIYDRLRRWARHQLERLFQATFRQPLGTIGSLNDNDAYSLLGAGRKIDARPATVKAACPFPTGEFGQRRTIMNRSQLTEERQN